jgi:hypothetical protein
VPDQALSITLLASGEQQLESLTGDFQGNARVFSRGTLAPPASNGLLCVEPARANVVLIRMASAILKRREGKLCDLLNMLRKA